MEATAIYHRPESEYAYLYKDGQLHIRIRTKKEDIKRIILHYGDPFIFIEDLYEATKEMDKVTTDDLFDYWQVSVSVRHARIQYLFELEDTAGEKILYGDRGVAAYTKENLDFVMNGFKLPFIHEIDGCAVPEWVAQTVWYQIFPERFANANPAISPKGVRPWDASIAPQVLDFFGGDLQGIIDHLDYLQELGITGLYLCPIFESPSNHKYDTIDYFEIDPCLGNKADLKELVQQCHKRGIRVILDGVFNHCGADFFAFRDVRQKGKASRYYNWFYHLPETIQYADPPDYEAFAYVKEMPKLNTGNPEVVEYLCNVGTYWIREADIDGWRLDVANEINHEFWRAFRHAVRAVKEDIFLIGEIWEEAGIWLQGDQFDSTMNYTFSYLCRDFFGKGELSVSEFDAQMQRMIYRYPWQVSLAQMNFLDSHDIPRFLSYCNGNRKRMELAFFYLFMGVGVPSVFYGDEVYIEGMKELEYRAAMDWQAVMEQQAENNRLQGNLAEKFSCWIALRKEHVALRKGNYRTIYCNDMMGVYVFLRSFGDDKVLVFLNTGTGSVTLTSVEVPQLQEKRIILSSCEGKLLVVL